MALEDMNEVAKKVIADMKTGPWDSVKMGGGFVKIKGRKAQVQVVVTFDHWEWVAPEKVPNASNEGPALATVPLD